MRLIPILVVPMPRRGHPTTHASKRSLLLLGLLIACGSSEPAAAPDSAQRAAATADSLDRVEQQEAMALADSARATLATLLADPASAQFDSVVVMRPPSGEAGRQAPLAVCGRIRGRPGIGGRATPTRFVYQTKWAVFVEESANRQAFADLMGRTCGAPGARVVVQ
jgi:hypothetical protein